MPVLEDFIGDDIRFIAVKVEFKSESAGDDSRMLKDWYFEGFTVIESSGSLHGGP